MSRHHRPLAAFSSAGDDRCCLPVRVSRHLHRLLLFGFCHWRPFWASSWDAGPERRVDPSKWHSLSAANDKNSIWRQSAEVGSLLQVEGHSACRWPPIHYITKAEEWSLEGTATDKC